jgi:hypothetical protein
LFQVGLDFFGLDFKDYQRFFVEEFLLLVVVVVLLVVSEDLVVVVGVGHFAG